MSEKIKAIIIDDHASARASLKSDIEDYCPQVDIVAEAESVATGLIVIKAVKPDLIFLDIDLGDGEGFDILESLEDLKPNVIFTTGQDEHALKAFRYAAIDYLLKPVDPDELQSAVERVQPEGGIDPKMVKVLSDNLGDKKQQRKKLVLHTLEKIVVTEIDDILRMESSSNYTQFYFTDGSKLLVTKTLKDFEKVLDEGFERVHQSHLINKKHITGYNKVDGGFLIMKGGDEVPVSQRKKALVVRMLDEL